MATLQITLSRAHKIAERLKQKIGEMHAEAVSQARTVTVTGVTGDSQVQRLVEQGERAMALTARADRFIVALAALRAQIGAQNEARGISAMLAGSTSSKGRNTATPSTWLSAFMPLRPSIPLPWARRISTVSAWSAR